MTDKIILQNLRNFTVQIRRLSDNVIAGTGLAISAEGEIITCAHVVHQILKAHPRDAIGAQVGVYFPQARGDEVKARMATVAACFPDHEDDVVLLQLDDPPPLGPEQMPKLGKAEDSAFNPFRSYGYRRLANYVAGHAHGTIFDGVESTFAESLHADPVQLESKQINQGMSGAGVLDTERNLVVGLVSHVWKANIDGIDQGTAWAVNGRVLAIPPLNVVLHDDPQPKQAAAQPQPQYREVAQQLAHVRPESEFHAAPPPLTEWVGRADLLKGLTRDYADPDHRVTGLIGFGGEGKSSLARRWVDMLRDETLEPGDTQSQIPNQKSTIKPDGVFWWGFYDNQNVDEFFEAALRFVSGGLIDPRRMPSSSAKAEAVAAMLANGRTFFVLDGLEVLQQQEGDRYGLLTSPDLQHFLELFAAPGHGSFCLVTSRAPLLDLMAYTSYSHRDVGPVTAADGRALLRALGVRGRDAELDRVVAQWDGHALTLSLLGSYLAWRHRGDIAFADEIDPTDGDDTLPAGAPDTAKQRYAHVHRVLRRYDEHLSDEERAFMTLFSAFRTPVAADAFGRVFRTMSDTGDRKDAPLQATLAALDDAAFDALVRNHYLAWLTGSRQSTKTHDQLKEYYLSLAGDTPQFPTMEQLAPLIEVVYHACRAGAYDKAVNIEWERISQQSRFLLMHQLGAYESELALMQQFFPNGDMRQEAQVSDRRSQARIYATIGLCRMNLGQLDKALPFYERQIFVRSELEDWHNASTGYGNLAELNANLARRAENKRGGCTSLARQAWADHLRGEVDAAGEAFQQVENLYQEIESSKQYAYSLAGIFHADHLRRTGAADYARRVTVANLEICERNRWPDDTSRCHRVLGELDADDGQQASARTHFDRALTIARGISHRQALIEALLARGRWAARLAGDDLPQAFSDLREALGYATDSGYRIHEADIRNGLGWARTAISTRRGGPRHGPKPCPRRWATTGDAWTRMRC